jgi:hypothetical protein
MCQFLIADLTCPLSFTRGNVAENVVLILAARLFSHADHLDQESGGERGRLKDGFSRCECGRTGASLACCACVGPMGSMR